MSYFADLLLTHRLRFAICLTLIVLLASFGISRLGFDEDPRASFAQPGLAMDQLNQLFEDFGPDDLDLLIAIDGDDLFTPESISEIRHFVDQIKELEGVDSVFSMFDARRRGTRTKKLFDAKTPEQLSVSRKLALRHPMIAGHLLSRDAKTVALVVRLAGESLTVEVLKQRIQTLRDAIDQAFSNSELRVRLAGHPAIRVDLIDTIRVDFYRFLLISGLVSVVLALFLFRDPVAVVIAATGPGIGVLWIMGFMGLVGENINGLNSVLPSVVFIIGFTDSVHLLYEMRRRRGLGEHRIQAVRSALLEVGPACFLTSLTTAIGFGSLMIAELEVLQRFGAACTGGTICCFVAVITIVPALASATPGRTR